MAGEMSFKDMLKVFFSILLAAMGISQARETFPDLTKASGAVQRVFSVIDRHSAIDIFDSGGEMFSDVPARSLTCLVLSFCIVKEAEAKANLRGSYLQASPASMVFSRMTAGT